MNRYTMIPCVITVLVGCVPPQPLATPSGRSEVTIKAPKDKIRSRLANVILDTGGSIKTNTEFCIVGGKVSDSTAHSILYGGFPEERFRWDLIDNNDGVRVVFTAMMVAKPDTAFEQVTTLPPGAKIYKQIQAAMEIMKTKLEAEQAAKPVQPPPAHKPSSPPA